MLDLPSGSPLPLVPAEPHAYGEAIMIAPSLFTMVMLAVTIIGYYRNQILQRNKMCCPYEN